MRSQLDAAILAWHRGGKGLSRAEELLARQHSLRGGWPVGTVIGLSPRAFGYQPRVDKPFQAADGLETLPGCRSHVSLRVDACRLPDLMTICADRHLPGYRGQRVEGHRREYRDDWVKQPPLRDSEAGAKRFFAMISRMLRTKSRQGLLDQGQARFATWTRRMEV